MDLTWRTLCLEVEGMLMNGPAIQIGFKADFRSHAGRLGIYLGNLSPSPLTGLEAEITVPAATQQGLSAMSPTSVQEALAPRSQALHMIALECTAPFAMPPILTITWAGGGRAAVHLPVQSLRFLTPWALNKDDYFRLWRTEGLSESQSKFTFANALDLPGLKNKLQASIHLGVLEGVDPSPSNICAAGALATKMGVAPPAPGGHFCLMRLEIVPDHATAPDGTKRAASRLTVRATNPAIAEGLMIDLAALLGGIMAPTK